MAGIVAEGTDGYKVLYSLTEIDPALHTVDVIAAGMFDVTFRPARRNDRFSDPCGAHLLSMS
jgi:hypothetical protein